MLQEMVARPEFAKKNTTTQQQTRSDPKSGCANIFLLLAQQSSTCVDKSMPFHLVSKIR